MIIERINLFYWRQGNHEADFVLEWGNSLALRIPKTYALEARLENNSEVEISLVEGKIVITPVVTIKEDFAHLLSGVTEENLHNECDTGNAAGKESW